jgi:hypothetical protein
MPTIDRRTTAILDRYTQRARQANTKPFTDESLKWYMRNVAFLRRSPSRKKLLKDDDVIPVTSRQMIGKMYMFWYDPKWKKELPYYDRFPLIFMADRVKKRNTKGFYGLNLHYLKPRTRAYFVNALYENYVSSDKMDGNTRLRISYRLLKNASKMKAFRPTFKQYLPAHIESQIVMVPAQHWETAIFLPTQSFRKANKPKVWADSELMIDPV